MAARTVLAGRGGRFGWAAMRFAAAAIMVVCVLGATIGAANATTMGGGVSVSKEEFIRICQSTHGTVTDFGDGRVRCDYKDSAVICNFNLKKCWDILVFPAPDLQSPTTHGEVGGGAILDDGGTSAEPKPITTTTETANSGSTPVLDDEQS